MALDSKKLAVLSLLYRFPLFCRIPEGERRVSVWLVGGQAVREAFGAAYWAGQITGHRLRLCAVCAEPEKALFRLHEAMPALSDPAFRSYASISFTAPEEDDPAGRLRGSCSYAIVATGDAQRDVRAVDGLLARFSGRELLPPVFRWDEEQDGFILENPLPGEDALCRADPGLERMARAVDFAYALASNPRVPRAEQERRFSLDSYNALSSYAAAVHVPYKLRLCASYAGCCQREAPAVLVRAIEAARLERTGGRLSAEDRRMLRLYHMLIALEHRRWCAEKIAEGYRAPTRAEFEAYAYQNGLRHVDRERKLHPCLCVCGEAGLTPGLWSASPDDESLSELDRASLLNREIAARRFAGKRAALLPAVGTLRALPPAVSEVSVSRIESSLDKLFAGVDDASARFYRAVSDAREEAKKLGRYAAVDRCLAALESDEAVRAALAWNDRTDFFATDAQLVELLPFCRRQSEEEKTVVILTGGLRERERTALLRDAAVPTALCAARAVFAGPGVGEEPCARILSDFFRRRGGNTKTAAKNLDLDDVSAVVRFLTARSGKDGEQLVCLDGVSGKKRLERAVRGLAAAWPIRLVSLAEDGGLWVDGEPSGIFFDPSAVSLDEFLLLTNGRYSNAFAQSPVFGGDVLSGLSRLFLRYSARQAEGSVWGLLVREVFQNRALSDAKTGRIAADLGALRLPREFSGERPAGRLLEAIGELERLGLVRGLSAEGNCASFVPDPRLRMLTARTGSLFELFVWHAVRCLGLFDEVQSGVEFVWQTASGGEDGMETRNEIDVMIGSGYHPIFLSCKDTRQIAEEMVYQLSGVSERFGAYPVWALSRELSYYLSLTKRENGDANGRAVISRALGMGVSVLGRETFGDEERLRAAMAAVREGRVVCGGTVVR